MEPTRRPESGGEPGGHAPSRGGVFTHPAVFYRGRHDYLDHTVPFLLDGQRAGEPLAVAVPVQQLTSMRAEFAARGGDVDRVRWLDMTDVGRNPGRIIPGVLREFADRHRKGHVRIIGEPIWAGRDAAEYPACAQHEALINAAFEGRDVTILCPYDAERLDSVALTDALATHPVVIAGDDRWSSEAYAPDKIVGNYNRPLPVPPDAETVAVTVAKLREIRLWAAELAAGAGLTGSRSDDITFVVNELVTNSVEHGTGDARLAAWTTGSALVFQTMNNGRIDNPLTGRLPVPPDQMRGRGLLTANLLSDLVRTHLSDDRISVRVYFTTKPTPHELAG